MVSNSKRRTKLSAVADALQGAEQRPTDHFQVCVLRPRHWPVIAAILTGEKLP